MFKNIPWKLIAGFVIHGIPKQTKVDNTLLSWCGQEMHSWITLLYKRFLALYTNFIDVSRFVLPSSSINKISMA